MRVGYVGLPQTQENAAVAAESSTGSSENFASPNVVEAEDAPSTTSNSAAVAAENATGSPTGSAWDASNAAVAAEASIAAVKDTVFDQLVTTVTKLVEDKAGALRVKIVLQDIWKRIQEKTPVANANASGGGSGSGSSAVPKTATVVAGSVLPTSKACSLSHPNSSVSAEPSIVRQANPVVAKAPPKIVPLNAMVMAANVKANPPPQPRAIPVVLPLPPSPLPRPRLNAIATHEELAAMTATQSHNLTDIAVKWYTFSGEHLDGVSIKGDYRINIGYIDPQRIGRPIRPKRKTPYWKTHRNGYHLLQNWSWKEFLVSLPESARNIVFPPNCDDTDRMNVNRFYFGQVENSFDYDRALAARARATRNGVPFNYGFPFPCWAFFVRMCDQTIIQLQPKVGNRKKHYQCKAVVVEQGFWFAVPPNVGKGITNGNGKGSTPNPQEGKGHRSDEEPAVAGNGTGSDGNGSVATGHKAPATEQAHTAQPAVAGKEVGNAGMGKSCVDKSTNR